ncbi:hypothetical protein WICPIJ_001643 [Wickerhamomyces pijperi]|uniref:Uncharacterized protein n=1 Tax=Wickerhamomyces pijperi TaxID=599730 RepID=A0A9P8TQX9_WICPI|nr:hypothetical protein WICPIJ_001643 [Wickerhamomyces pijperi]
MSQNSSPYPNGNNSPLPRKVIPTIQVQPDSSSNSSLSTPRRPGSPSNSINGPSHPLKGPMTIHSHEDSFIDSRLSSLNRSQGRGRRRSSDGSSFMSRMTDTQQDKKQAHNTQQKKRPVPVYSQIQIRPHSLSDILRDNNDDDGTNGNQLGKSPFAERSVVSFDCLSVKVSHSSQDATISDHYNLFSHIPEEEVSKLTSFSGLNSIDMKSNNKRPEGFAQNAGIMEDSLIRNYQHSSYLKYIKQNGKGRSFVVLISGRKHTWVALDYAVGTLLQDGDHLIVVSRIPDNYRDELLRETHRRARVRKEKEMERERSRTRSVKSDFSDRGGFSNGEEDEEESQFSVEHEDSDEDKRKPRKSKTQNKEDLDPDICLEIADRVKQYIEFMIRDTNVVVKLSIEIYLSSSTKSVLSEILRVHAPQAIVTTNKPLSKYSGDSITWSSSRISDRLVQFSGVPVIVVPALKSDAFQFDHWSSLIINHNLRCEAQDKKLSLYREDRLRTKIALLAASKDTDDFENKGMKNGTDKGPRRKRRLGRYVDSDSDSDSSSDSDSESSDEEAISISESESLNARGRQRQARRGSTGSSIQSKQVSKTESQMSRDNGNDEDFSDESSIGSSVSHLEDDDNDNENDNDNDDDELDDDDEYDDNSRVKFDLKLKLRKDEDKIKYYIDRHTPSAEPEVLMDILNFITKVNHDMSDTLTEMIAEESKDPELAKLARSMTGVPEITKSMSMFDFTDVENDEKSQVERNMNFKKIHNITANNNNIGTPSLPAKSIKFGDLQKPTSSSQAPNQLRRLKSSVEVDTNHNKYGMNQHRPNLHPVKSESGVPRAKPSSLGSSNNGSFSSSSTDSGSDKSQQKKKKKGGFFKALFRKKD